MIYWFIMLFFSFEGLKAEEAYVSFDSQTEIMTSQSSLHQTKAFQKCWEHIDTGKSNEVSLTQIKIPHATQPPLHVEQKYLDEAQNQIYWDVSLSAMLSSFEFITLMSIPTYIQFRNLDPQTPHHVRFWAALKAAITGMTSNYFYAQALAPQAHQYINTGKTVVNSVLKNTPAWVWDKIKSTSCSTLGYACKTALKDDNYIDPKIQYFALKRKYEDVKFDLSLKLRNTIDDILGKIESTFFKEKGSFSLLVHVTPSDLKRLEKFNLILDALLNLPLISKRLHNDEVFPKLKNLLADYSEVVSQKMTSLAELMIRKSQVQHKDQNTQEKFPRSIIYLKGPLGLGKNYLAENFAKVLDLPLVPVELRIDSRVFKKEDTLFDAEGELNELTKAISSLPHDKRYKNAILLIKDFDSFMPDQTSYFERIFNPNLETKTSLQVHQDIASYTFILTGSKPLDSRLLDHVQVIEVDRFSFETKQKIACQYFGSISKNIPIQAEYVQVLNQLIEQDYNLNLSLNPLKNTLQDFINQIHSGKKYDLAILSRTLKEKSDKNWDINSAFTFLSIKFEKEKHLLSESVNHKIETHLEYIKNSGYLATKVNTHPAHLSAFGDSLGDPKIYFDNLNTLMKLPRGVKYIEDNESTQLKVEGLLKDYPEKVRLQMRSAIGSHIDSSQPKDHTMPNPYRSNILYFNGEPSTGKSYLSKALGEVLDLPVIYISLEDTSVGQFRGMSESIDTMEFSTLKFKFKPSKLTKELLPAQDGDPIKVKNAIIVIDEVEKILNNKANKNADDLLSVFLKLTDPENKTFHLGDVELDLDTSHFLWIFIGNELVDSSPFNDRVEVVKFDKFPLDGKIRIAQTEFKKIAKSQQLIVTNAHLTLVEELVRYEVETYDKGLRSILRTVNKFVKHETKNSLRDFDFKQDLDNQNQKR